MNPRDIQYSWGDFKLLIIQGKKLPIQYCEPPNRDHYKVFAVDQGIFYYCEVDKQHSTDKDDFVDNYKDAANEMADKTTLDGKKQMHQTSRPLGTYTYFTSSSDDCSDPTKIGGNVSEEYKLKFNMGGSPTSKKKYLDLNIITNQTHIHEGYIMYKDAVFDEFTFEIIPRLTSYSSGSNTNYSLYGGYLIIPAAGNGDINLGSTVNLVQCVENEFGIRPAGFWNADFNESTKEFENITPAPSGDGEYNMFTVEVTLARFANKVILLGNGFMQLQSSDQSRIGHNNRIRVTAETIGDDHNWKCAAILTFHRKKTC